MPVHVRVINRRDFNLQRIERAPGPDGKMVEKPFPFPCDICHDLDAACYARDGVLYCTQCWQIIV